MTALALALSLLLEVSIQIARLHDRAVARRSGDFDDLSDDEASPIHPVTPVERADSVESPPSRS